MTRLRIETPRVFVHLLEPSRYKGAKGGRGSGKSHFFAERLVEDCVNHAADFGEGMLAVCIREIQATLNESAKRLITDKINKLFPHQGFKVYKDVIRTPKDGLMIFRGMKDYNAESIKSLEGYHRAWIEEAQTISARSLELLRPTIREEGSEIWASWNPRRKSDPIDMFFREGSMPEDAILVKANWSDNPFFPEVLNKERLHDLQHNPETYDHIWEGGYATVTKGAYYAKHLIDARRTGRIGFVPRDPLMTLRAWWDIGGTGAKADATAIWIGQFINNEVRILDYYEAVGQDLATHIAWLRLNGYGDAFCVLPHDGDTNEKVYDVSYASALKQAGFQVRVIPNQGKGAAKMRIEAARRLFPSIRFNESTTEAGRDCLGWYHEKRDEDRNIGLGPEHDWSSHASDAFGLMAIDEKQRPVTRKPLVIPTKGIV